MTSLKKTKSFKVPEVLELDILQKVIADGYGLRGKSRWICDSILSFLSLEDEEFILDAIEYADELRDLNKSISFRLTEEVEIYLSDWVIKARQKMPSLEGVKSKIIRAAIMQSLLGSIPTIYRLSDIQKELL